MSEAEAQQEKQKGNDAYKKRDFPTAVTHYQQAWELHKDITFLNNLAAVYFEQGEYDKSIEVCQQAVDEGRELRADYKLIAKALARIGNAYSKKTPPDFDNALKFYQKSLTEHRTPDTLAKVKEIEKSKAEAAKQAYIDPELSDAARNEGNVAFKAGDFATSIKHYTESISRNPSDPRGYTNRAQAYTKLLALSEAMRDADKAISVDPTFVKGYVRKSAVLFAMRDYQKSMEVAEMASERDTEGKNATEIRNQVTKCVQAMSEERSGETDEQTLARAMRDPEIQEIMSDPVMQQILQQGQSDPASLQSHLKNPMIKERFMKLAAAGIIKTR